MKPGPSSPHIGQSRGGTNLCWQTASHYFDAGELEVDEAVHGGGAVVGEVVMGLEGGWLFNLLWILGLVLTEILLEREECSTGPVDPGSEALQSCGPVALQSCGPIALQSCGPVALQSCGFLWL